MRDDQTFKPGDTVRLRSDGPLMTVIWVNDEEVGCTYWNAATSVYSSATFIIVAVEHGT